jgi:hypothetical protein
LSGHAVANRSRSLGTVLTPIIVLALGTAIVAWTAAWFFREQFVLSAVLIGIGCLPIVVAVVGYLFVLTKKFKS